ncbi:Tripartite-type tricarboxylate transporter, receptor component TctC [Modicisalibacter muralis]|uniref:Tripartite-type tricarboxylate transporter, receptor component TctC n=1 Tax=Modicisalibacter muralis TaxID=119000 RepID=A0A1G9JPL7_9GAMM|nr:tripartite tricarboxylate transporter substrate binding protein [Halomonas muralis]SDL39256.1 Tripartite-type tricarboxylate transporter, receptor component TctC [Halomonas muralis]
MKIFGFSPAEKSRGCFFSALAIGAALSCAAGLASAQEADYPNRPVELIVPWSPGGGSDTLMRIISNNIEPHLGVPMPVINMPGVSGTLGLAELARREPDGYTIGQVHEGLLTAFHTGLTKLNWDDFAPIAGATATPQYWTVSADSPWQTFEEFVEYAKANPGEVRVGVTLGGISHVHPAMIEDAAGLEFRYVGYEGTGDRIRALVGGHIDAAMGDVSSSLAFVESDDLRFLAVGSTERVPQTPDVPTFEELGYDSLELSIIRGIVAPEGTPEARIDTLESALKSLSKDEAFVKSVNNVGVEVQFMGTEEYTDYLENANDTIERLSGKLQK